MKDENLEIGLVWSVWEKCWSMERPTFKRFLCLRFQQWCIDLLSEKTQALLTKKQCQQQIKPTSNCNSAVIKAVNIEDAKRAL